MSIRVLIVEDESLIRWSLRQKFEERGYQVVEAADGKSAIEALEAQTFDLAMLDYRLPDTTGVEILRQMKEHESEAAVVMMTAYSSIESAVEAIKLGAFDYVAKPFQIEHLLHVIDKALETTRLRREVRDLRRRMVEDFGVDTIVGQHPRMKAMISLVQQVARAPASTVLLRGETGTGKDLVARVIHQTSERAANPFVNVTCTALSETLLESELFGHERGSFTDAKTQKKGLFELADGGTVFLDEIGDMAASLQAKLLRFLEERRFRRVGGTREITVDVRVIAATNRSIEEMAETGKFREDLYYRLNVVRIDLPPLRECASDVRLLAQHFVARFAREFKRTINRIDEDVLNRLMAYSWPGNVRELRNVIERAVLLCRGEVIRNEDIVLGSPLAGHGNGISDLTRFELPAGGFNIAQLNLLEASVLKQAMERTRDNKVQAAKLLGITRDTLRYRLRKHGLLKK